MTQQFSTIIDEELNILKKIDEEINVFQSKLIIFKSLNPTNIKQEFETFKAQNGHYNPQFEYQMEPLENLEIILKYFHDKYIEYFGDKHYKSIFSQILKDKLQENITKTKLLIAYQKQDFEQIYKLNIDLFDDFSQETLDYCQQELNNKKEFEIERLGKKLNHKEVIEYIKQYIKRNNIEISIIEKDNMMCKISVKGGKNSKLEISKTATYRHFELDSQLEHEIGTHLQRASNGQTTGRKTLRLGTSKSNIDEEGLAILNTNKVLISHIPEYQNYNIIRKYLTTHQSSNKTFAQMYEYIQDNFGYNIKKSFNAIARSKLGIRDTAISDIGAYNAIGKIYLDGYNKIKNLDDTTIKNLMIGKIKLEDFPYLLG